MTIDPTVIPGLLLLAAELTALAAFGYVIVRTVLRQHDQRMALAQGLVVGPALWGLIVNFILYAIPGLAGAAVGWGVMLAAGAGLAWRARHRIRPRPHTVAGYIAASLALFWAALASRQALSIPDPHTQLGLAASIRAGAFPPELFWNPGMPAPYHHGIPLLAGLLMPPVGPDLGFVTELLGAYVWMSFALVITTLLLQRASGFTVVAIAPLLITGGAWTFTWVGQGLLQIPVLAGMPAAGFGASLMEIYWPPPEQSWEVQIGRFREAALPDIWKPGFPLAYALLVIVLERAARGSHRSWPATLTKASLVGFVGLSAASLAPLALALWAGLEAVHLWRARCSGTLARSSVLQWCAGLALAVLLLLGGGGRFVGIMGGAAPSGLNFSWNEHQQGWRVLGSFDPRSGGVGVLGVGPLLAAVIAALLARHDRLVQALAMGSGLLALAYVGLSYTPYPLDLDRLAGHARNLALVALLVALSVRLARVPPRWRYISSGLLMVLVTWPTVVGPARSLALAVGHGPLLTNAQPGQRDFSGSVAMGRFVTKDPIAPRVSAFIRDQTALDAHVLDTESPYWNVSFVTGRPSNAGFAGLIHLFPHVGPEYRDARGYLEPTAIRRLGIEYVRATEAWVAALPPRAQAWLGDPRLFELLVQDDDERLFRVRRAFLSLDVSPHPASFEALRQAVPSSATVYLVVPPRAIETLRIASTLSHARLVGQVDPLQLHLLSPASWHVDPLTHQTPDLVVLPTDTRTWMSPSLARTPIWWSDQVAVYAPNGAVDRIMETPATVAPSSGVAPPLVMGVTNQTVAEGRIEFAAAFHERDPQTWSSQDWIVLKGDSSPWAIPTELFRNSRKPTITAWFAGLLSSGGATTSHTYRFDPQLPELSVRNDSGDFVPLATSGSEIAPGGYILALRLRHEYQPNHWRDAGVIPALRVWVAETGEVSYEALDDVFDRRPLP